MRVVSGPLFLVHLHFNLCSKFASGGNCFSSVDKKDWISNINMFGCKTWGKKTSGTTFSLVYIHIFLDYSRLKVSDGVPIPEDFFLRFTSKIIDVRNLAMVSALHREGIL